MFKISCFILCLGLFFVPFFSYGQGEDFLSDLQVLEQEGSDVPSLESSEAADKLSDSEIPSLESSEELGHISNSVEKSVLSVKGGGLISAPVLLNQVIFIVPISLELQTPFKNQENLKWLVQVGGGGLADFWSSDKSRFNFHASVDTGLRYDWQPWIFSLTLGAYVTPQTFSRSTEWAIHPVLAHIKWALSAERKFTNVYVGLTGGSFATIYTPFLGVSVRYPLKTW